MNDDDQNISFESAALAFMDNCSAQETAELIVIAAQLYRSPSVDAKTKFLMAPGISPIGSLYEGEKYWLFYVYFPDGPELVVYDAGFVPII